MADKNKVLIEFQIVQKGKNISVLQKETEKLSKSQDKAAGSQKKLSKQQEIGYGRQKQGLVQTANGTKNFSKLAQTINGGGGTSLVGAYATLAANVFAASAAFGALSRAAQFQQLQQGLDIIGSQSGRTLGVLAEDLREATKGALSLEQASTAAALGVSGGFGAKELSGLAEIAQGASIALGRDLADAFDRLTRGAIKLEPEILDELGIMVRLDDAVEKYAAQLGKSANALSQTERRQAFMNEILEQGAVKFGDIAEKADPTPYQQLGASFADLTKDFFTFINETINLNAFVQLLADNTLALTGVIIGFGSTIATQMIPALGNQAVAARAAAEAASEMAEDALQAADDILDASREAFLGFKDGAGNFKIVQDAAKSGSKATIDYKKALVSLKRSESSRQRQLDANNVKDRVAAEVKQADLRRQILLTEQLMLAEENRAAAQITANLAILKSNTATVTANTIEDFTTGQIGLGAAIGANSKNISNYFKGLTELNPPTSRLGKLNVLLKQGFAQVGGALKILTAGFLKFLPIIGVVLVAAGLLAIAFKKVFFTPEIIAYNKQFEKLETILGEVEKKASEYQKAINGTLAPALAQQREYNILANTIKEINEALKETIRLQELTTLDSDSRRVGFGSSIAERADIDIAIEGGVQTVSAYNNRVIKPFERSNEAFAKGLQELFKGVPELVQATIGDVSKLTDKELKEGLKILAKIDDTAQYQSLLEALQLEPYRKFLLEGDNKIDFSDLLTDDPTKLQGILDNISKGVDLADKRFGTINDAVNTFSATLKEGEKIASQFLQKFFPKTSVGDTVDTLKALDDNLKEIKRSSKDIKDEFLAMGQALSETGPTLRKFFGKDVADQIKELRKAEGELKALEESGEADTVNMFRTENNPFVRGDKDPQTEGDIKRAEIQKILVALGMDGTQITEKALELSRALQNQEILRKETLANINLIQKSINKATKQSAMAATVAFQQERRSFKVKQEQMDTQLLMQGRAVGAQQEEIKTAEDRNKLVDELKEKLKLKGKEELKDSEKAGIRLTLQQLENLSIEDQISLKTAAFDIQKAGLEVQLQALAATEKMTQAEAKIAEIQAKSAGIRSGRKGEGIISQIDRQEKAEAKTLENLNTRVRLEKSINTAKAAILKAEIEVLKAKAKEDKDTNLESQYTTILSDIDTSTKNMNDAIDKAAEATREGFGKALENAFADAFSSDKFGIVSSTDNTLVAALLGDDDFGEGKLDRFVVGLQVAQSAMANFANQMKDLFGEDGAVISSLANLGSTLAGVTANLVTAFETINKKMKEKDGITDAQGMAMKFAAVGQAISSVLSAITSALQAQTASRVKDIDQAIESEKKLDGKSAESLAKIQAMEKKKEAIERKSFERNKKLQIANAIISTAAAAAGTYAALAKVNPVLAMAMAGIIGALGLAQVAIIKKTSFQGGGSAEQPKQTSLQIGKRSSAVDTAQTATGGELNYLRGGNTTGQNLGGAGASFPGAAMGRKGYADGGVVVGERGPEVITPAAPVDVTPNYALGGAGANVNFTINAVDAAGVEDVLMNQRGNLIRMIREAANENGERFLETVDTQTYGGSK